MTDLPDRSMRSSQRDNRRRFSALLVPIVDDLYRFALRLERNAVRAEDLMQQSVLIGLTRFHQLEHDAAFRVWMSRILYRTHLNQRTRKVDMPVAPEEIERKVIPLRRIDDPDQVASRRELGRQLASALDSLPDEQREAVWLVDGQGFKYAEAAKILHIAPGTVASRVARGRIGLRRLLHTVAKEEGVIR